MAKLREFNLEKWVIRVGHDARLFVERSSPVQSACGAGMVDGHWHLHVGQNVRTNKIVFNTWGSYRSKYTAV